MKLFLLIVFLMFLRPSINPDSLVVFLEHGIFHLAKQFLFLADEVGEQIYSKLLQYSTAYLRL